MSKAAKFDDIDLMQYADGEVDDATANEIAAYVEENEDAAHKVQALGQMQDTVRSYLELAADDAEPRLDALWASIESRIQANGVSHAHTADADIAEAHIERAPARASQAPATSSGASHGERQGILGAIGRFFDAYRGHFFTGMVAAGAAAALVLALRSPRQVVVEKPVVVREPVQVNKTGPETNDTNTQVKLVKDDSSPPEIEEFEVNGGSGTVFIMPKEGEDDVSATVIFVDLNDDVEGPL